jgi:C4-dicarboxylate-specific signal transduction histidine kinase
VPQALEQVLVNLLLNASHAAAEVPSPALVIGTGRSDRWCWVEVSDNDHAGTG